MELAPSALQRLLGNPFGRVGVHPLRPDEADIQVEGGRGQVVGLPADPDAFGAEVDESVEPGGEKVTGEATALVVVLGAHRFDESDTRDRVVPAKRVAGALARLSDRHEIEVRPVERRLAEAVLDVWTVASDEPVFSVGTVLPALQPVPGRER